MADKFFAFLKDKFNIVLTDAQKEAVAQKDGKIVLISTPGSGKTTCNVCRCANLILTHGVKPENIMSVTFSRAAAIDMENRFNKLFGNIIKGRATFSTIHSFALKVINDYSRLSRVRYKVIEGSTNNDENSELDSGEFETSEGINKISILKKIYYSVNKGYINDDIMDDLLGAISYVNNMMIKDEEIAKMKFGVPKFFEINSIYKNFLDKNNYLDYDHMLTKAYEVLKSNPLLLKRYKNQYLYIQVDEAQDTSNIQHEIIYLISHGRDNILFVGDDDQSIYEWRGANPDALLSIDKKYPGAKIIYMEENFRSTKQIVSAANGFIKANKKRYNKNLYTKNKEGSSISIVNLKNDLEQIDYLINIFKKSGMYSDHAVLFRNNVSAISLADALDKNGIPFYAKDTKQAFFKHWVLKDIVSILKLGLDNSNIEMFEKVYYKLNSYISKAMVEFVKQNGAGKSVFTALKGYPGLTGYQLERINNLISIFARLGSFKPELAINFFIEDKLSYKSYLEESCEKLGYSMGSLNSILGTIKSIARNTNSIIEFITRLDSLRKTMSKSWNNRYGDAVILSTIHSSKGLEYKNVYMIDLIDEQFPTADSIQNAKEGKLSGMEEERRIFYVGMTRARDNLTLVTINNKNDEPVRRSRFVDELDNILKPKKFNIMDELKERLKAKSNSHPINRTAGPDYNSLCRGDIVTHIKFGSGPITNIDIKKDFIEIKFYGCGEKKLSINACKQNNLLMIG